MESGEKGRDSRTRELDDASDARFVDEAEASAEGYIELGELKKSLGIGSANDLELLDANFFLGKPVTPTDYGTYSGIDELTAEMAGAGVTGGLVWHIAQRDCAQVEGNRLLAEAIRDRENLWGCWTITPPQTREVVGPGLFAEMKANRIYALRAYPEHHRYMLRRSVFGSFFDELTERRIPLLVPIVKDATWPAVYDLLEEAPEMTVVLCDLTTWGCDRWTWPLMAKYRNVYVETSYLSLHEGELEGMVSEFGADRVLFGSGFPEKYVEAAALQLAHADISDEDKRKIAAGNLRRLMAEVGL